MAKPSSKPGQGQGRWQNDEVVFATFSGAVPDGQPGGAEAAGNASTAPVQGTLNSLGIGNGGNGGTQVEPGNVVLPDMVSPHSPSPVIGSSPDGEAVLIAPLDKAVDPPVIGGGDGDPSPPIIVPGPTPPPLDVLLGTDEADVLVGTPDAEIIDALGGNDVLISNGGGDHLLGGAGDDIIAISHPNIGKIDGGAGDDTLVLADGIDLNLSAISARTDSIENLDLSGGGANEVTLVLADLLNMTDDGQLTVAGSPHDTVNADFSGHQVSHSFQAGFDIYTIDNGLAQLMVQNQVDQNIVS